MDAKEKIEQIREKVKETSIYIARVPKETKSEFMIYAKSDFENDYGMAFKWVWDFRKGLLTSPNRIITEQLEVIVDEIQKLKQEVENLKSQTKTKKVIRSVSGNVIAEKEE